MSPAEDHRVSRRHAISSLAFAAGGALVPATGSAQAAQGAASSAPAARPKPGAGLFSVPDYEEAARKLMTVPAHEYYECGCADDVTVRWNREALTRIRLESRVLVNVARIDTRITLLGQELPHPILLAPAARHRLVHPDGEVATVKGAGAAGAIMVASTVSNCSVEEICAAATQPVWFQLYADRDRGMTRSLIQKAEAAGCKALCLTVDQTVLYARDRILKAPMPDLPLGNLPKVGSANGQSAATRARDLTWDDIEWFRSVTRLPLLLKGVLHPDDADEAVKRGVAAIIVSNHGGRALDTVAATIDALPRVADRVAGRAPILMDGGIRRGTDVLKALGRGASATLIGRPYLYGLCVNGSDGVRHVIEILREELEAAMVLTGRATIRAIDKTVMWPEKQT